MNSDESQIKHNLTRKA